MEKGKGAGGGAIRVIASGEVEWQGLKKLMRRMGQSWNQERRWGQGWQPRARPCLGNSYGLLQLCLSHEFLGLNDDPYDAGDMDSELPHDRHK